jgi:MFS family permease
MSHHHHPSHYHFFKNKELNHFYLAIALMALGQVLITLFVPIYLFKLGYAISSILFFYFLISLSFVIFSYAGAKVVSKIGIKHSILWSTPFLIAYFLGLKFLPNYPWLFFILPFLNSFRMILYNYGYHLNYVTHSDKKKRGREISFIGSMVLVMYIIAPLIGGILAGKGFGLLYLVGSGVLLIGTLPLFLTKDNREKFKFTEKEIFKRIFSKKRRGELISYAGYSVEFVIGLVLWPIFLIMILLTVEKTGLIVTLSMLGSIIAFYFIGKITDKFDKIKLIKFGTVIYALGWFFRIFAKSQLKILIIDSYKNFTQIIVQVPWAAQSVDLAVKDKYFAFIVGREIIFNLARVIMIPVLMLVFFINYHPFTISFIIAGIFSIGYGFLNKK